MKCTRCFRNKRDSSFASVKIVCETHEVYFALLYVMFAECSRCSGFSGFKKPVSSNFFFHPIKVRGSVWSSKILFTKSMPDENTPSTLLNVLFLFYFFLVRWGEWPTATLTARPPVTSFGTDFSWNGQRERYDLTILRCICKSSRRAESYLFRCHILWLHKKCTWRHSLQ